MPDQLVEIPCDFVGFMDALKRLRKVDDLITVRMNREIPASRSTHSITDNAKKADHGAACAKIYSEITVASNHRVSGINRCLAVQTEAIKQLSDTGDVDGSRQAENHLRLMKRELQSEAILKTQVLTHFAKRCSTHFTPPPETT